MLYSNENIEKAVTKNLMIIILLQVNWVLVGRLIRHFIWPLVAFLEC